MDSKRGRGVDTRVMGDPSREEEKSLVDIKLLEQSLRERYGVAISNVELFDAKTRKLSPKMITGEGSFTKIGACESAFKHDQKRSGRLDILMRDSDRHLFLYDDGHYFQNDDEIEQEGDHQIGLNEPVLMPIFLPESSESVESEILDEEEKRAA